VPVNDFAPNRSQRRTWSQYAELTSTIIKPHFSAEHYALYTRYQKSRHAGGGMDQDDMTQYIDFLVKTNVPSFMVEFRQHPANDPIGDLKMVSIIDRLNDGLSAVYTFYAPELRQNYGTFNVLWQIQQTRALGLNYLYLGYWISACRKMSYKTRFKPCELFVNDEWRAP
jgi:arginine-tRNA-protein transferase